MLISKNCKKDNDEKRRDMIWENNYRVECMYGKKKNRKTNALFVEEAGRSVFLKG